VDIPAQRATRVILRQPLPTGAGQIGVLMRRAPNVAGRAGRCIPPWDSGPSRKRPGTAVPGRGTGT